ncbi:MAG: DUF438 domain-containing protein [Eubacteriales bacterium]|nr:DUF438 domain-containing protein [Eubacteriales bacterium]MDD4540735.1 DUF438 domain-containing protein [Eubacteriales bacterium]
MSDKKKRQTEALKNILHQLSEGASVEDVREEFQKTFDTVDASEIAAAEAELIKEGTPVEVIQQLCNVHASVVEGNVEVIDIDPVMGHPLTVFYKENDGLEEFLAGEYAEAKSSFLASNNNEAYVRALNKLYKLDKHYARKENLMFPYLEKKGITAPPKVMWGKDDEIRDLIKKSINKAEAGEKDETLFSEMELELRGMIQKENEILKPMLVDNITDADWKVIAQESSQFGYAFVDAVEGASPSDVKAWIKGEQDLDQRRSGNDVELPSGYFNAHELEAVLNTMPYDITYVNADNKVQYFSEGKERVFPRTRTIIGRLVEDCHPPKSLSVVNSIVEDFKSGKKDHEHFWIQKDGAFIMIRYYAVRDVEGVYLGVIEVTEEISELRSLEGSKTLLND